MLQADPAMKSSQCKSAALIEDSCDQGGNDTAPDDAAGLSHVSHHETGHRLVCATEFTLMANLTLIMNQSRNT